MCGSWCSTCTEFISWPFIKCKCGKHLCGGTCTNYAQCDICSKTRVSYVCNDCNLSTQLIKCVVCFGVLCDQHYIKWHDKNNGIGICDTCLT
jgi:hypothetical protein